MMKKLILASKSIYRKDLLNGLGVPFEVRIPKINEAIENKEKSEELALRLSIKKAESVILKNQFSEIIIGADQVASINGEELKKPSNEDTAIKQLLYCQNKSVVFFSAVTIIDTETMEYYSTNSLTATKIKKLSEEEISFYVKKNKPYDCSGGIKIEKNGIALFEYIKSNDPSSILGLPLIWVSKILKKLGINPLSNNF
jgi:septum formation protein